MAISRAGSTFLFKKKKNSYSLLKHPAEDVIYWFDIL